MQTLAEDFLRRGFGMVAMVGLEEPDGEPMYRCFSTVSKEDMYAILDISSLKVAMMPVGADTEGGEFLNRTNTNMDDMAIEAAAVLSYHNPMIIGVAGENCASILVVGKPPMLTYMCARMMAILKMEGPAPEMFRFFHSDN